jgi:predicted PurR-regulated permease PerM
MPSSQDPTTGPAPEPAAPAPPPHGPREREQLTQVVFYGTVLLIAWLMWKIVEPFLIELGWAAVLAICLDPVRGRLEPRLGKTRGAIVLVLGVLLLLVVPLVFLGYTLADEGATSVDYVQQMLEDQGGPAALFHRAWDWARSRVPALPEEQVVLSGISASVGRLLQHAADRTGSIVARLLGISFSLVITLSILFFLLRDATAFARALRRVMPFGPEQNERFISISSELVSASVTSTLAVAAVQGVIGGVAFVSLGVPGALLWAVMMTILAFLPLIGSALVWAPVAVWLALTGHLVKGIVLALVGLLVIGNVDNVVRPLLLSGKSKLNTLVLIISLMGGVSAFGFIGIVLGPLVAVLLTAIVDTYAARVDDARPAAPPAPRPVAPTEPPAAGTP